MSSEWKDFRLGDFSSWSSGSTPSKKNEAYWGGAFPWISASSMKQKALMISDQMLTEEGILNGGRLCQKGDILLLVRGSELHKRIPIGVAGCQVAFNQDVKAIRTNTENLKQDYLYHLLKGSEDLLLSSVEFTGIGAGKLDTPFLQDLVFPLPPINEQDRICELAGAIDNKIELNQKINETLEGIAKGLFKSWFVDFDPVKAKTEGKPTGLPDEISELFPDSFEESELGEIPSGWRATTISNLCEVVTKGTTPTSIGGSFSSSGIPFYKVESISESGQIIPGKCAFVSEEVDNMLARSRINEGDILFSIAGTIGRVALMGNNDIPANTNQALAIIRAKKGIVSPDFLFLYLRDKERIEVARSKTVQSVQANFSLGELKNLTLVLPDDRSRFFFEDILSPIRRKIFHCYTNYLTLTCLRDALLPRLISGELRVPDAQKILEEVGI